MDPLAANQARTDVRSTPPLAPPVHPVQSAPTLWARFSGLFFRSPKGPSTRPNERESTSRRRAERLVAACLAEAGDGQSLTRDAGRLMQHYQAAPLEGRLALLAVMGALGPGEERRRLLEHLQSLPDGLRFLVGLRADLLAHQARLSGSAPLEADLKHLLALWFDVDQLELRPLSWDSPASVLEKLIRYEAVHTITSWGDLRNRLDADRQCYALFHPRMAGEPLIFVEVAFTDELADNVSYLLDQSAPLTDEKRARWAIFYSISNTQQGLRGISFGGFLLKRVMAELGARYPRLRGFATLSPVPGFRAWLETQDAAGLAALVGAGALERVAGAPSPAAPGAGVQVAALLTEAAQHGHADAAVREIGLRLCARYLLTTSGSGVLCDPVARFHLGNGAAVERINWAADPSAKGQEDSIGLMVNYRYVLADLERNRAALASGAPRVSRAVGKLL